MTCCRRGQPIKLVYEPWQSAFRVKFKFKAFRPDLTALRAHPEEKDYARSRFASRPEVNNKLFNAAMGPGRTSTEPGRVKFEQIPLFYPRGCAAPLRGITPIATLERFVVYFTSELIISGRAPGRGPEGCSNFTGRSGSLTESESSESGWRPALLAGPWPRY